MSKNEPTLPLPPLITSQDENWDGIYLRYDRQPAYSIPEHSHALHTLIVGTDDALFAEWSIDGEFKDLQYNQGDIFLIRCWRITPSLLEAGERGNIVSIRT